MVTRKGGQSPGLKGGPAPPQASRFPGPPPTPAPCSHVSWLRQNPRSAWPSARRQRPGSPLRRLRRAQGKQSRSPGAASDRPARRPRAEGEGSRVSPRSGPGSRDVQAGSSQLRGADPGVAARACALAPAQPARPAQRPRSPWQPSNRRRGREGPAVGPGSSARFSGSGCPSAPLCASSSTQGGARGRPPTSVAAPTSRPPTSAFPPGSLGDPWETPEIRGQTESAAESPSTPPTKASAPGHCSYSARISRTF